MNKTILIMLIVLVALMSLPVMTFADENDANQPDVTDIFKVNFEKYDEDVHSFIAREEEKGNLPEGTTQKAEELKTNIDNAKVKFEKENPELVNNIESQKEAVGKEIASNVEKAVTDIKSNSEALNNGSVTTEDVKKDVQSKISSLLAEAKKRYEESNSGLTSSPSTKVINVTVKNVRTVEDHDTYQIENSVLFIGDSIMRGYGSDAFYTDAYDDYGQIRNAEGTIPSNVAKAVGCTDLSNTSDEFFNASVHGLSLKYALETYGIETDCPYNYEQFELNQYRRLLKYYGDEKSIKSTGTGEYGSIIDHTINSDLIVIELGFSDISYQPINDLKVKLKNLQNDITGMSDEEKTQAATTYAEEAVKLINESYNYWKEEFPVLIETIQELNPDTNIVVTGIYNFVGGIQLSDGTLSILPYKCSLEIGNVINLVTDNMNNFYKAWSLKYGYTYVDISDIESYGAKNNKAFLSDEFLTANDTGIYVHPDQNGYDEISNRIIAALPEGETKDEASTVDTNYSLNVDLDNITDSSVDIEVLLDGQPVTDYSLVGSTLVMSWLNTKAQVLTVSANIDGQTYSTCYELNYGNTLYEEINEFKENNTSNTNSLIDVMTSFFENMKVRFEGNDAE